MWSHRRLGAVTDARTSMPGSPIMGWVNFVGTDTVTVMDSENVTSITDNGTGDYTITWTQAQAATGYALAGLARWDGGTEGAMVNIKRSTYPTTTSVRLGISQVNAHTYVDARVVTVLAVSDLLTALGNQTVARDLRGVAWAFFSAAGTITASHNVSGVVQNSTGDWTVTWRRAFTSTSYALAAAAQGSALMSLKQDTDLTASSATIVASNATGGRVDPTAVFVLAVGRS